jgi:hypothetical protein
VEHRAAAFVDHSKPAHFFIRFQFYMFFRIHLPGVVWHGRSLCLGLGSPSRRRRGQIGAHQPALERAFRGNRPIRRFDEQLHPDQSSPPGRVRASEIEGGLHTVGRRSVGSRVAVTGRDAFEPVAAEPLKQTIDR